jgi:hypothetical protein
VPLAGVLGLRLSEHAMHTWDIAVTLDPAARVAPDAVGLLVDRLPLPAGFLGKQAIAPVAVAVTTAGPRRAFTLDYPRRRRGDPRTGGHAGWCAGRTSKSTALRPARGTLYSRKKNLRVNSR